MASSLIMSRSVARPAAASSPRRMLSAAPIPPAPVEPISAAAVAPASPSELPDCPEATTECPHADFTFDVTPRGRAAGSSDSGPKRKASSAALDSPALSRRDATPPPLPPPHITTKIPKQPPHVPEGPPPSLVAIDPATIPSLSVGDDLFAIDSLTHFAATEVTTPKQPLSAKPSATGKPAARRILPFEAAGSPPASAWPPPAANNPVDAPRRTLSTTKAPPSVAQQRATVSLAATWRPSPSDPSATAALVGSRRASLVASSAPHAAPEGATRPRGSSTSPAARTLNKPTSSAEKVALVGGSTSTPPEDTKPFRTASTSASRPSLGVASPAASAAEGPRRKSLTIDEHAAPRPSSTSRRGSLLDVPAPEVPVPAAVQTSRAGTPGTSTPKNTTTTPRHATTPPHTPYSHARGHASSPCTDAVAAAVAAALRFQNANETFVDHLFALESVAHDCRCAMEACYDAATSSAIAFIGRRVQAEWVRKAFDTDTTGRLPMRKDAQLLLDQAKTLSTLLSAPSLQDSSTGGQSKPAGVFEDYLSHVQQRRDLWSKASRECLVAHHAVTAKCAELESLKTENKLMAVRVAELDAIASRAHEEKMVLRRERDELHVAVTERLPSALRERDEAVSRLATLESTVAILETQLRTAADHHTQASRAHELAMDGLRRQLEEQLLALESAQQHAREQEADLRTTKVAFALLEQQRDQLQLDLERSASDVATAQQDARRLRQDLEKLTTVTFRSDEVIQTDPVFVETAASRHCQQLSTLEQAEATARLHLAVTWEFAVGADVPAEFWSTRGMPVQKAPTHLELAAAPAAVQTTTVGHSDDSDGDDASSVSSCVTSTHSVAASSAGKSISGKPPSSRPVKGVPKPPGSRLRAPSTGAAPGKATKGVPPPPPMSPTKSFLAAPPTALQRAAPTMPSWTAQLPSAAIAWAFGSGGLICQQESLRLAHERVVGLELSLAESRRVDVCLRDELAATKEHVAALEKSVANHVASHQRTSDAYEETKSELTRALNQCISHPSHHQVTADASAFVAVGRASLLEQALCRPPSSIERAVSPVVSGEEQRRRSDSLANPAPKVVVASMSTQTPASSFSASMPHSSDANDRHLLGNPLNAPLQAAIADTIRLVDEIKQDATMRNEQRRHPHRVEPSMTSTASEAAVADEKAHMLNVIRALSESLKSSMSHAQELQRELDAIAHPETAEKWTQLRIDYFPPEYGDPPPPNGAMRSDVAVGPSSVRHSMPAQHGAEEAGGSPRSSPFGEVSAAAWCRSHEPSSSASVEKIAALQRRLQVLESALRSADNDRLKAGLVEEIYKMHGKALVDTDFLFALESRSSIIEQATSLSATGGRQTVGDQGNDRPVAAISGQDALSLLATTPQRVPSLALASGHSPRGQGDRSSPKRSSASSGGARTGPRGASPTRRRTS